VAVVAIAGLFGIAGRRDELLGLLAGRRRWRST
jgi:hypothetical protein